MYCIIQRETHRDRGIEEVFGPYPTKEAADKEAEAFLAHDKRWRNGQCLIWEYDVWPMTANPEPTKRD